MPKVPYPYEVNGKLVTGNGSLIQSNLAIRNFLVTLKLFLNAKSIWSKWQIRHRKWFLNTNLFLIKPFLIAKFDCICFENVYQLILCGNDFSNLKNGFFFAISSYALIEKMNSSFLLCITYWIFFGSISRQISLLYEHLFYSAFDWELVEPLSYGYHPSTSEAFCWHFCCICSLHIGPFW